MPDQGGEGNGLDLPILQDEIVRLKKIVQALMDRAERSASVQSSDFGLFQTAIVLEEQVRSRTAELEAALRENEAINHALRESEAKFRGLVSQSLVGISIFEDGKFSYSNAKFDEIFGYGAEAVRELGLLDITVESDRPRVAEQIRRRLSGEVEQVAYAFSGLRKNGAVIDIETHGSAMEIRGKRALISLVVDVTERTRAARELQTLQDRLREQATHDALTGLHNRHYLEESLSRELILARRHGHPVSLIMADLDLFKAVNDRYGHLAGDSVLRVFGDLIRRHARGSDISCRYGGEEFLLVLPQMAKAKAVERAKQLCCALAAARIAYGESSITVTASFGVATFPGDGQTGDQIIAAADRALYAAKTAGRNRVNVSGKPVAPEVGAPEGGAE